MKLLNYKIAMVMAAAAVLTTSCEDMFDPAPENLQDETVMYQKPDFAYGVIGNSYRQLPYMSYWSGIQNSVDLACDDAYSNDDANNYVKMLTAWNKETDPTTRWVVGYNSIQYVNILLENVDAIIWDSEKEVINQMYRDHFRGEALVHRALQFYYLLRVHAGMVNGEVLGLPIHTSKETGSTDFNQSRPKLKDCVDQILKDLNEAIDLLPYVYGNIGSTKKYTPTEVPAKYLAMGAKKNDYDLANGDSHIGQASGELALVIRAQVALWAASPAYAEFSGVTYADALKYCAAAVEKIGKLDGLQADVWNWYSDHKNLNTLNNRENPGDVIWREGDVDNNSWESENYPPSLYGKGRVNPSQNLVDAFPMLNGYPITDPKSGYDPQNPYENRDPRLAEAILCNGGVCGVENTPINTQADNTGNDGMNVNRKEGSTTTGYYLKKHLYTTTVNLNPTSKSTAKHSFGRIRWTEIFLAYAEAANEAIGPDSKGDYGMSAYDIVKKIRQRCGIVNDEYLESIKSDKEKMREMIRNERRLELCFENQRFYDIRRWKMPLNEPIYGMKITGEGSARTYEKVLVATPNYGEHQYYGAISYTESLKYSNLVQNTGW